MKIKYGLRNVKYSKITIGEAGKYEYASPVPIPGAVNLTLSPTGDTNDFYADDVIYFSASANQGYEGDLEIALLPESFLTDILGMEKDKNGVLHENAAAIAQPFALGFEVQGDSKGRRTWLYNCSAARPNQDASTKESGITPSTETLSLKAMPRETDLAVKATIEPNESNEETFNSFFESVYEKDKEV